MEGGNQLERKYFKIKTARKNGQRKIRQRRPVVAIYAPFTY